MIPNLDTSAIAKSQNNAIANLTAAKGPSRALASDRTIPRLLLMQGTSSFVMERKANLGDMIKSTTGEKLGDPEHPIEFIPLNEPIASWRIEEKQPGGKFKYRFSEPRTAKNDNLAWSFGRMADGREVSVGTPGSLEYKRIKCLTCFFLLPKDIDAQVAEKQKVMNGAMPDLNKFLTPLVVQFRATGIDAGKVINDHYAAARNYDIDGCNYVLNAACEMQSNDSGVFYNFKIDRTKAKPVSESHRAEVMKWAEAVRGSEPKIDEEPEDNATAGAPNATSIC